MLAIIHHLKHVKNECEHKENTWLLEKQEKNLAALVTVLPLRLENSGYNPVVRQL